MEKITFPATAPSSSPRPPSKWSIRRVGRGEISTILSKWFLLFSKQLVTLPKKSAKWEELTDLCFLVKVHQYYFEPNPFCFVAEQETGVPLSVMILDFCHPEDSEPGIEVSFLCSHPDRRISGIKGGGSRLLSVAEKVTAQQKLSMVYIGYTESAKPFYTKYGYHESAELEETVEKELPPLEQIVPKEKFALTTEVFPVETPFLFGGHLLKERVTNDLSTLGVQAQKIEQFIKTAGGVKLFLNLGLLNTAQKFTAVFCLNMHNPTQIECAHSIDGTINKNALKKVGPFLENFAKRCKRSLIFS